MLPLSPETRRRIQLVFPAADQDAAAELLGRTDFDLIHWDQFYLDRVRFSVLKRSGGDLAALRRWVEVAETDWRDAIDPDFSNDPLAHAK